MTQQPSDPIQAAIRYIDRRLATIDQAPGTWGSPESLELQTLLLFEIRHFLLRRRTYAKNPYEARRAFFRFVREHIKDAGAALMATQIPEDQLEDELPKLLGMFRDDVALRIAPENPFDVNELVVELVFEGELSGKAPFAYWAAFQDALTAIHKDGAPTSTVLQWSLPEFQWIQDERNSRAQWFMHTVKDPAGVRLVLEAIENPRSATTLSQVWRLQHLQGELSIKAVHVGGTVVGARSIVLESKPATSERFVSEVRSDWPRIPPAIRKEPATLLMGARFPKSFPAMRNIESSLP